MSSLLRQQHKFIFLLKNRPLLFLVKEFELFPGERVIDHPTDTFRYLLNRSKNPSTNPFYALPSKFPNKLDEFRKGEKSYPIFETDFSFEFEEIKEEERSKIKKFVEIPGYLILGARRISLNRGRGGEFRNCEDSKRLQFHDGNIHKFRCWSIKRFSNHFLHGIRGMLQSVTSDGNTNERGFAVASFFHPKVNGRSNDHDQDH